MSRRQRPQRRVSVDLPGDLTAPSRARAETREVLATWQLRHLLDSVLLVVSELAGNAARHGQPPLSLDLRVDDDRLTVGVHDAADALPPRGAAAEDEAEGGRGLAIVESVSEATGTRATPPAGKVAWASFPTAEGGGGPGPEG